jgi:hypothetical protein
VAGNTPANILGGFTGAPNLTSGDPLLAPFGNYGGPLLTMLPLPGSRAIDAGGVVNFGTDQRGFARDLGAAPDLGAVEGILNPAGAGRLTRVKHLGNGAFQFAFSNYSGGSFSILATTNVMLPLNTWSNLGPALETPRLRPVSIHRPIGRHQPADVL